MFCQQFHNEHTYQKDMHIFKQSERTFLAESMYLCKWRFAGTEYMDEQPDENSKQNVLIRNSGSVRQRSRQC